MARRTIKLKDYLKVVEEYPADAAITPGTFVALNSTGEVAAVANEESGLMVAVEDNFQGKTISDNYAADAMVQCWIPQRGDVMYGVLASGQNVAVGAKLAITTGGKLTAVATATGDTVAIALEAVNATSADARIIARIV